jgi:hypothetical protein
MVKDAPGNIRLLHGYGFRFDWCCEEWAWYSDDQNSSSCCDGNATWCSAHVIQAIPRGVCPNGCWYWDIIVDDWSVPVRKDNGTAGK